MIKRTKKLTLSAALTALITVLLYLGSLIEVLDLVTVFLACVFVAFAVLELGGWWYWMVWAASALLSVLLLPNKFAAIEYLMVGLLTILKNFLERLPPLPQWLLKFLSFNALYAGMLCLFFFVLGVENDSLVFFGVTVPPYLFPVILAVLGNLCYLLYDILLTRLIALYLAKYSDRVRRWLTRG